MTPAEISDGKAEAIELNCFEDVRPPLGHGHTIVERGEYAFVDIPRFNEAGAVVVHRFRRSDDGTWSCVEHRYRDSQPNEADGS